MEVENQWKTKPYCKPNDPLGGNFCFPCFHFNFHRCWRNRRVQWLADFGRFLLFSQPMVRYPPGIERHVHASLPTTVIFFQKSTGRAGFLKCHRDGGIMEGFTVRLFETWTWFGNYDSCMNTVPGCLLLVIEYLSVWVYCKSCMILLKT